MASRTESIRSKEQRKQQELRELPHSQAIRFKSPTQLPTNPTMGPSASKVNDLRIFGSIINKHVNGPVISPSKATPMQKLECFLNLFADFFFCTSGVDDATRGMWMQSPRTPIFLSSSKVSIKLRSPGTRRVSAYYDLSVERVASSLCTESDCTWSATLAHSSWPLTDTRGM